MRKLLAAAFMVLCTTSPSFASSDDLQMESNPPQIFSFNEYYRYQGQVEELHADIEVDLDFFLGTITNEPIPFIKDPTWGRWTCVRMTGGVKLVYAIISFSGTTVEKKLYGTSNANPVYEVCDILFTLRERQGIPAYGDSVEVAAAMREFRQEVYGLD